MNQLFREEIFHDIMDDFQKKTQKVMFDSINPSISAIFGGMGGFDGEILTEINFMHQYDEREEEILQIFSTLVDNIEESMFEEIEGRLNELNQKCMFGNFMLYRKQGQIAYRYAFPMKVDDSEYSMQLFHLIWNELYHTMNFFFAYLMVMSTESGFISLEQYIDSIRGK